MEAVALISSWEAVTVFQARSKFNHTCHSSLRLQSLT